MNAPRLFQELRWNRRPLTYADFEGACDRLGVIVQRARIDTPGMYFMCRGKPVITLSDRLCGVQLWFAAFHELAHHLLHAPGLRCFSPGSVSKAEAEAEALAICAVIDEQTLYQILAYGELHDFPRKMLSTRMKVLNRLKF